jgi:hypothetical protein
MERISSRLIAASCRASEPTRRSSVNTPGTSMKISHSPNPSARRSPPQVEPVGEPAELLGRDPHQLGVVVPEREHPGSRQGVNENVSVEIADETTRHLVDRDREMSRIDPRIGLAPILFGE